MIEPASMTGLRRRIPIALLAVLALPSCFSRTEPPPRESYGLVIVIDGARGDVWKIGLCLEGVPGPAAGPAEPSDEARLGSDPYG